MRPSTPITSSRSYEELQYLISNFENPQPDTAIITGNSTEAASAQPENAIATNQLPARRTYAPKGSRKRHIPVVTDEERSNLRIRENNESNLPGDEQNKLIEMRRLLSNEGFSFNSAIRDNKVMLRIGWLNTNTDTLIHAIHIAQNLQPQQFGNSTNFSLIKANVLRTFANLLLNNNINKKAYEALESAQNDPSKMIANLLDSRPYG